MILTLIIVSVAAFFNAVMDTLAHHFGVSIFKRLDSDFWDARTSAAMVRRLGFTLTIFGKKRRFIDYPVDAWHIAKSMLLICFLSLPLVYTDSEYAWYVELVIMGTVYISVFTLLYGTLFYDSFWNWLPSRKRAVRENDARWRAVLSDIQNNIGGSKTPDNEA